MQRISIFVSWVVCLLFLSPGLALAQPGNLGKAMKAPAPGKPRVAAATELAPLLRHLRAGVAAHGAATRGAATTSPTAAVRAARRRAAALDTWAAHPPRLETQQRGGAAVVRNMRRGVTEVRPAAGAARLAARQSGEATATLARRYVKEHPDLFALADPERELALTRQERDATGRTHLFYNQQAQGVALWGRQLAAHVDGAGNLLGLNGQLHESRNEPLTAAIATPALTAAQALAAARQALAARGLGPELSEAQAAALGYARPQARLTFWQAALEAQWHLAWVTELRPNVIDRYRFFIDAHDGTLLQSYNTTTDSGPATASALNLAGQWRTINTYQIGSTYHLLDGSRDMFVAGQSDSVLLNSPLGAILTLNLDNHDYGSYTPQRYSSEANTWSDPSAVSFHDYIGRVYGFYQGLGRKSYDNQGATIKGLLHVTDDDYPMDNAYWNGEVMAFGDGYSTFSPLAGGLDVIAHEYTHAVTEYSANLEYMYESGALNESMSDVFAALIDDDDYQIGEDIVIDTGTFPSGALRDLANPHNGGSDLNDSCWQPATMAEYEYLSAEYDSGGVHVNGGIPNNAAYQIMTAIGRADTAKIYYQALTQHLLMQSDFADAAIALAASAGELFGPDSAQRQAVVAAFDAVGVTSGGSDPGDVPAPDGMQYLLLTNADMFDTDLYLSEWSKNQFSPLTVTGMNTGSGRPVAPDPWGQNIYFIDSSENLEVIKPLDTYGNKALSSSGEWWSVALSPAGTRMALTHSYIEKKIILADTLGNQISELNLRHPNGDGTYQDIVLYPDSLAWLSDRLLAYDVLNEVTDAGGSTRQFWEINIINVETGEIVPAFAPQGASMDCYNPVLPNLNHSWLVAEQYDSAAGTRALVAKNLFTGTVRKIIDTDPAVASGAGYGPDDRTLFYSRTGTDGNLKDVYRVALAEDRVTTAGAPELYMQGAQLPVAFTASTDVQTPSQPNLTPSAPAGGAAALGVAGHRGTLTEDAQLYANQTLYVDWAVANVGALDTAASFTVTLSVDGQAARQWSVTAPLAVAGQYELLDAPVGPLAAGTHTLRLTVDPEAAVAEFDETDNAVEKTVVINPATGAGEWAAFE